jgi:sulfate permease, SulP family
LTQPVKRLPAVPVFLLPSLRGYRRSLLGPDALAALTLLAIAVPEQLATSRLAGMPPITGFYAFIAGGVGFALLGANRQLSVGADSTIAPLFAAGVAGLAATGSRDYVDLVAVLAIFVGVLVTLVGVLRLGWIAEFLSTPIITGFLVGVAIIIVVHQLPDLLGIAAPSGTMVHRVASIARHLGEAHVWSLSIGIGVLLLVVVAERVDRRLPAALVGLTVATVVVSAAHLRMHGVQVLGAVAHRSPLLSLAGVSWSDVWHLTPLAVVVALVVVSQTAATVAAFPGGSERATEANSDFTGVGAAGIVAGLVGAFPVDASPPRTAAVAAAGGRSQLTSLLAAAAMAALVPLAFILDDVPLSALAGILLWVASRIVRVRDLRAIARFSRFELGLAALGAVTVAFVGVEQGILVAVGVAALDRARRSARPGLHVLGRIPGTTSFAPVSGPEHTEQVPGILVVLFAVPLWYGNALHFRLSVHGALDRGIGAPRAVVLDALGMSDIDYTGSVALRATLDELDQRGITVVVARAGRTLRAGLEQAGLEARIGRDNFFDSVGEAVSALSSGAASPSPT